MCLLYWKILHVFQATAVKVGSQTRHVHNPATVFVPADAPRTYRFISGRGSFINFVHKGEYSQSLLEL